MKIGIFLTPVHEENNTYLSMNYELYTLLKENDITVVGITNIKGIENCCGVILPGGNDNLKEEIEVIKYLHKENIPTLGICMGMQLMGEVFNGSVTPLPDKRHLSLNKKVHQVQIKKGSLLHDIIKEETIVTNSRHVDNLVKTDLDIVAYSNDGVIEAIEDKAKSFFIGVEWHPESNILDKANCDLFTYFLKKCHERLEN